MRVLVDTHVLLWWLQGSRRLSKRAQTAIATADEVFVSSASIWELAINAGNQKIRVDLDVLASEISSNGFQPLMISHVHAKKVAQLPLIHRDPFDRMLVAQAECESLKLLTADRTLSGYSALIELI